MHLPILTRALLNRCVALASRHHQLFPVLITTKSEAAAFTFRSTAPGHWVSALHRVKAQLFLWLASTSTSTIYYSNSWSSPGKNNKIRPLFLTEETEWHTDGCSDRTPVSQFSCWHLRRGASDKSGRGEKPGSSDFPSTGTQMTDVSAPHRVA